MHKYIFLKSLLIKEIKLCGYDYKMTTQCNKTLLIITDLYRPYIVLLIETKMFGT